MKLHWSPRSPFVRKVNIVLAECGLTDAVERMRSVAVFAAPPNPDILRDNPLGKIPVLITDDGRKLFDSRVICEYLIGLAGRDDLLPTDPETRFRHLRWQALGDGLTDILLLWRIERARGDHADPVILGAFETKVRASLDQLEAESAELADTPFGLGHIAVVCAIGQLDFRYADCGWRAALPNLARWHAGVAERPSVAATAIVDDGAGPPGPADGSPAFTYEAQR
ncbi:MAG: glutathione S-transferase N-terminal domain-containing protein [Rhodobacterales bacterium]|nr:glutathione S-transferase N-terminal domain-containing protein [Rhodobacterales bacterium]